MKKFIESEIQKIQAALFNHQVGMEASLKQVSAFIESLIIESAAMDNSERTQHLTKGLLSLDSFIRQNIQLSTNLKEKSSILAQTIELYEKNKQIAESLSVEDSRKIRKIGEKPTSIKSERNVKKDLDMYQETNAEDS